MARYLLLPANNTLSHLAKCLALRDALTGRGHDVQLAVSTPRASLLLDRLDRSYHLLPDLSDVDASAVPTFGWFRASRVEACIRAELELMRKLRPDRVLGVFRFTGPLSARLAGIPYDSLICGSMTPACDEILGFDDDEPGATEQGTSLNFFRTAAARHMAPALARLKLPAIDDLWQLLEGDRTFLWDTPEFQPLHDRPDYHHVGPLNWSGWPCDDFRQAQLDRLRDPIAFLAFGTGGAPEPRLLMLLVEALWRLGYSVVMALGGLPRADWLKDSERLVVFDSLPSALVLPRTSLLVCHGGQMLVFEALRQRLPVLVLPMQPEQAQNGRCLERLNCGRRLLRGIIYDGRIETFATAVKSLSVQALTDTMAVFLQQPLIRGALGAFAATLTDYHGAEAIAAALEYAE